MKTKKALGSRTVIKNLHTVSETVEIKRPIKEVFNAVTTANIWTLCYPETVATGGITRRPFKKVIWFWKNSYVPEQFMYCFNMK